MKSKTLYTLFALTGAAPFVACAVLPLVGITEIDPFGPLVVLASVYALAIICFLAGIHWATELYGQKCAGLNLFVASNAILLAAGTAYVTAGLKATLVVQSGAFLLLLWIDYRLLSVGTVSTGNFRVRCAATTLAVLSLMTIVLTAG